jgi:phospholipid/cholesterol/gamma-HCH transport system permease protein
MKAFELSSAVGLWTIMFVRSVGMSVLFLLEALSHGVTSPIKFKRVLEQIVFIGARSVVIIMVTGGFTGMVLGLQSHHSLLRLGSEGLLGSVVALSLIRELGPVLSALMVAGRAGSAITSEIGIMRMTEQISALEMMAVHPVKYIITPKIYAGLLSLPLLTALFDVVGIAGGYLVGVRILGVSEGAFFGEMKRAVEIIDVFGGFIKSVIFGLLIVWICSLKGYLAVPTAEGVASATTSAVVYTSVAVLIVDYMLTAFLL